MSDNSIKRPGGITILAWLYLFGGGLWLLIGPYMGISEIIDGQGVGFVTEYFPYFAITTIISAITFSISFGLFKGKKWSWFLGVFPIVLMISIDTFDKFVKFILKITFHTFDASILLSYIGYCVSIFIYCYI